MKSRQDATAPDTRPDDPPPMPHPSPADAPAAHHPEAGALLNALEVRLLGGFALSSGEDPLLSVRLPRQQELISWLLLHPGRPQPRSRIAAMFWPDSSDEQGRNNLRKVLHELRQASPQLFAWIASDRASLTWLTEPSYGLDVDRFSDLARSASDAETVRAAVSAYGGDLLPDCYEEWILPFRFELQHRFVDLLERGIAYAEKEGDHRKAIAFGEQLLQEEPLREDAYASLIRLHTVIGDRAGALRVYHACATTLEQELGVAPGTEVAALYGSLLTPENRVAPSDTGSPRAARSAFVGRENELQVLQSAWRSVTEGRPSVAVITGDPGIGKTRLAEEMQDWAQRQGIAVRRASCHDGEETLAFSGITQILAGCPLASLPPMYRRELALLVPASLEAGADLNRSSALDEEWQRRILFESVCHALLSVQPLIVLVDDLQWCDADTLLTLEYLLRFDPSARCLLLATARLDAGQTAMSLFRDATLHHVVTEVELGPLDRAGTLRVAAAQNPALAPLSSDRAAAEALYQETEGNPLFVVELARAGWTPAGGSPRLLPHSLQSAVRARFARLSPGPRQLLDVAAAVGANFRLPILASASHQPEDDLVRNVDELWRLRIIREQAAGGYEFAHAKLREVAYGDLTTARRANLHAHVAAAYRAHLTGPADPSAVELARHLELAGRPAEAGEAYLEAAGAARRLHANQSAAALYRRALDLIPPGRHAAARVRLGETLQLMGEWEEANRVYRQALRDAQDEGDSEVVARCRMSIGDLLRLSGRFSESLEWLRATRDELEREPPDGRNRAALARVTGLICDVLLWLARYAEAEECAQEQLALAEAASDPAETAAAGANLGTVYARRTQYDLALRYYLSSLALEEQLDDPVRLPQALGRLGNLYRLRGEFQLARATLERQLALARHVGDVHAEAVASANLSNLLQEQGELSEAGEWLEKSLLTFRRLGDRQREAASLGNLGLLLHSQGDLPRAWECLARSVAMQSEVGDRRNVAVALVELGMLYGDAAAFDRAMECLSAGMLISLDIENPQNITIAAGAIAEVRLRQGRLSEAEQFAVRAVDLARRLNMSHWLSMELSLLARLYDQAGRLEEAGAANAEALDLTAASRHSEIRFKCRLLQVRLRARLHRIDAAEAQELLQQLAGEYVSDGQSAAIAYELWRLAPTAQVASDATRRYLELYRRAPNLEIGQRLAELTGEPPPSPPPLPDPPPEAAAWSAGSDRILEQIDHLYARLPASVPA